MCGSPGEGERGEAVFDPRSCLPGTRLSPVASASCSCSCRRSAQWARPPSRRCSSRRQSATCPSPGSSRTCTSPAIYEFSPSGSKRLEQLKVQRPTQQSTECQIISRCIPLVVHAEHKVSRGCLMLDYLSLGSTESKTA